MEIYVNGQQLDVYSGQDVEISWTNIRFADSAIPDEWSTDVELPQSQHNIQLLEAYGLLDRGPLYTSQVPCSVLIKEIAYDGYLHVTAFSKDTITATVYILTIPYELYDKELRDYYPADDQSSIFRWDRLTKITTATATSDIAVYPYDYNSDYYSNINAQMHPSVRAEKIHQLIEAAEGVTLPTLNEDLFLTATKQVVSPNNKIQCFAARWKDNAPPSDPITLIGGQHITNDFACEWSYKDFQWNQSWSDWDIVDTYLDQTANASANTITFNRFCSCRIRVYGNTNRATWNVHVYRNDEDLTASYIGGTNLYRIPNGSGDTPPTWDVNDCLAVYLPYVEFSDGDTLQFRLGVTAGSSLNTTANVSVVVEYISYQITDNDYETELNYYPMLFGLGFSWLNALGTTSTDGYRYLNSEGGGFGVNGFLDHSFCYYGLWANMGSCSIREFITNMCWVHGQKLLLNKKELIFQPADQTKELEQGNITEIQTVNDKLAKRNEIKYKDANQYTWWNIENDFLDKEKTIFESIFSTSKYRYGKACVEQYEFESMMTEPNSSGESWVEDIKVTLNDFDFLLFTLAQVGNGYQLERAYSLDDFGLQNLNSVMSATIETYDDVKDIDFVYYDGRRYLVTDGSVNADSGLATLNCIEIPNKFRGGCEYPTITYTATPYVTECVIAYSLYDNTMAGDYTLTVAHNGVTVDTYPLTIGVGQTITVRGLDPLTTYTLTFSGSNSCGTLYERGTVVTDRYPAPQLTVTVENVTYDRATVQLTYSGAYPVTNLRLAYAESGSQWTDIQVQQTEGTQTVLVSGLNEMTQYDLEATCDWYLEEVTAVADFTTDERIKLLMYEDWAVDGTCTSHLVVIADYDNDWFLDDWTWSSPDISGTTATWDGHAYVCDSTGHIYGSPVMAEISIGVTSDGYYKYKEFEVVVPTQNLVPDKMRTESQSTMCQWRVGGLFKQTSRIFNYDLQNCTLDLVETTSGDTVNMPIVSLDTYGSYFYMRSNWTFYIPIGTYIGHFRILNIMGQDETSEPATDLLQVPGAMVYALTASSNRVTYSTTFNHYYDSTATKRIELCDANGHVLQTATTNAGGQSGMVFSGLTPSTDYLLKVYFDAVLDPVVKAFKTTA